jgi:hypothetical protein
MKAFMYLDREERSGSLNFHVFLRRAVCLVGLARARANKSLVIIVVIGLEEISKEDPKSKIHLSFQKKFAYCLYSSLLYSSTPLTHLWKEK